jgi:PAS domain S-box-containing protein
MLEALTAVMRNLPSGVAVLDAAGHVVLANDACRRLLGLQATDTRPWTEQVAGYQVHEAARGRFVALAERPLARALAGESIFGWKGRLRPPGGPQYIWLVVSAVPLRDVEDHVTGAVGIVSEVSRQHNLESDLSGCLHRQRRLLERIAVLERELAYDRERATRVDDSPEANLSPREREILELIGLGQTNGEIAAKLDMSLRTVKTHVEHLFRKLGVTRRTQAAMWAERRSMRLSRPSKAILS